MHGENSKKLDLFIVYDMENFFANVIFELLKLTDHKFQQAC